MVIKQIMKNIHLIPTDKPSRLSILNSGKLNFGAEIMSSSNSRPQNLYITSDEKPEDGDWGINLNSPYEHKELCRIDNQIELERYVQKTGNDCKKIILTTDQDLIKDGVQAIDDEFLEWFVKNPSCEEVEVDKNWNYPLDKSWEYKLRIIPQETTIEEIRKYAELSYYNGDEINAFVNGAKWQAERMYSEEEVFEIVRLMDITGGVGDHCGPVTREKWFEQFKKK
jgi:hypothetical protein